MNTPGCGQTMEQQTVNTGPVPETAPNGGVWRERLSAVVDGADPTDLPQVVRACADQPDLVQAWREYQWVGDILRHGDRATLAADPAFARGVMARLADGAQTEALATALEPLPVPGVAANDAVFKWRLAAGVAGLGLAAAVLWQVLAGAPASTGGPQLAAVHPPAEPGLQVVVNTPQGAMVRDPELEALMAAHRQSGGMSALQRPAGFMRNAAFESGQR